MGWVCNYYTHYNNIIFIPLNYLLGVVGFTCGMYKNNLLYKHLWAGASIIVCQKILSPNCTAMCYGI